MDLREIKAEARGTVPEQVLARWRPVRDALLALRLRGDVVQCPVCAGRYARFAAFNSRAGARCPGCSSLERHRLLWRFLERDTDLFTRPQRVLHIAPERYLRTRLAAVHGAGYVYGDVADPEHRLDVTSLPFPDGSFDVVLCSHVFEHVHDDALALAEVRRVLSRDGWAVLDAPVDEGRATTYEDPTITSAKQRRQAFKQWDHVRIYGRDYVERLQAAGFNVQPDRFSPQPGESERCGLRAGVDRLYLCRPR